MDRYNGSSVYDYSGCSKGKMYSVDDGISHFSFTPSHSQRLFKLQRNVHHIGSVQPSLPLSSHCEAMVRVGFALFASIQSPGVFDSFEGRRRRGICFLPSKAWEQTPLRTPHYVVSLCVPTWFVLSLQLPHQHSSKHRNSTHDHLPFPFNWHWYDDQWECIHTPFRLTQIPRDGREECFCSSRHIQSTVGSSGPSSRRANESVWFWINTMRNSMLMKSPFTTTQLILCLKKNKCSVRKNKLFTHVWMCSLC